jgi:hypothetical protein
VSQLAEHAGEVLSSGSGLPTTEPSNATAAVSSTTSEPASIGRMRTLWLRMTEIYGHRWTSAYGDDCAQGAGETWAKGLAGISAKQLAHGLSTALASADPWPPTLPAFRSMCLGIPSFAAVKQEFRSGTTTRSGFAVQVWNFLDGYVFARSPVEKAERLLQEAYNLAAEFVMRGGSLPQPATVAIEKRKPDRAERADPEFARQYIDQVRDLLGEPEPEAGEGSDA